MIPGFVDDRKFTDIVLNFYKRGIRDGAQMMLDTLEMKEVDLEKEIHLWIEDNTCGGYCSASIRDTAEYFYELGLKAKGE